MFPHSPRSGDSKCAGKFKAHTQVEVFPLSPRSRGPWGVGWVGVHKLVGVFTHFPPSPEVLGCRPGQGAHAGGGVPSLPSLSRDPRGRYCAGRLGAQCRWGAHAGTGVLSLPSQSRAPKGRNGTGGLGAQGGPGHKRRLRCSLTHLGPEVSGVQGGSGSTHGVGCSLIPLPVRRSQGPKTAGGLGVQGGPGRTCGRRSRMFFLCNFSYWSCRLFKLSAILSLSCILTAFIHLPSDLRAGKRP